MSDIAAFIEQRLTEDEQVALAVGDGDWGADQDDAGYYEWQDLPDRAYSHARRHDPARVLAEVAAKRAILAAYRAAGNNPSGEMRAFGHEEGLEDALMLLAHPYADHLDFDPEWALPEAQR